MTYLEKRCTEKESDSESVAIINIRHEPDLLSEKKFRINPMRTRLRSESDFDRIFELDRTENLSVLSYFNTVTCFVSISVNGHNGMKNVQQTDSF